MSVVTCMQLLIAVRVHAPDVVTFCIVLRCLADFNIPPLI